MECAKQVVILVFNAVLGSSGVDCTISVIFSTIPILPHVQTPAPTPAALHPIHASEFGYYESTNLHPFNMRVVTFLTAVFIALVTAAPEMTAEKVRERELCVGAQCHRSLSFAGLQQNHCLNLC